MTLVLNLQNGCVRRKTRSLLVLWSIATGSTSYNRGIVEPEDDMRETNPPTNPELLDQLAEHFIASGYDLKGLVRTICNSQTYQLSAIPNEYNESDKQNFSRYYPRTSGCRSSLRCIPQSHRNIAGVR